MTGSDRQLWVLRHAKASPNQADDHSRPLVGRGRRQCAELAAHLVECGLAEAAPVLVLASTATRAVTTAELVLGALDAAATVQLEPSLYGADVDEVLDIVRLLDESVPAVMVVGHNPTLEELVWVLVQADEASRTSYDGLSTGALAVVGLEVPDWASVGPHCGRLLAHYAPSAR